MVCVCKETNFTNPYSAVLSLIVCVCVYDTALGNPAFGVPAHLLQMVQEENTRLQQRRYTLNQLGVRGSGSSVFLRVGS